MKRECNVCGTMYSFNKKDVVERIKYRKGQIILDESIGSREFPGNKKIKDKIHILQCVKDLKEKYIICKACNEIDLLTLSYHPCYPFIKSDEWIKIGEN